MKLLLMAIVLVSLSGCEAELSPLSTRKCSTEQWEKAAKEAKDSIEIDTSGSSEKRYSRAYLEYAVQRNCER